jgi:hypothetical protein
VLPTRPEIPIATIVRVLEGVNVAWESDDSSLLLDGDDRQMALGEIELVSPGLAALRVRTEFPDVSPR